MTLTRYECGNFSSSSAGNYKRRREDFSPIERIILTPDYEIRILIRKLKEKSETEKLTKEEERWNSTHNRPYV